ncbi:hypothetical protein ACS0TY_015458 [Phlomoides rotata]
MVGLTLSETWLGNIWKSSRKGKSISLEPEKQVVGILAFEVSRLMSKVVSLWLYLTDTHMLELREEMNNSIGIQKLVSDNEDYLMNLALAEIFENFTSVGKFVAMLGKKCVDPIYHDLEGIFADPCESDPKWYGWWYRLQKMEKRVKKMRRFVAATEQLHSEMESLEELEESMRRTQGEVHIGRVKLLEFQRKVFFQRQEVENLREMSPWIRTYDYIVRLLLRSLFTIIERIKFVYGGRNEFGYVACCNSMLGVVQTSGYLSDNNASRGHVGRSLSNISPLSILCSDHTLNLSRFAPVGLSRCLRAGSDSEIFTSSCGSSFRSNGVDTNETDDICTNPVIYHTSPCEKVSFFNSKRELLNARPSTLGYAALALHYAKIILSIEKLASSPHLISLDAREDLYDMLPFSIRRCVRAKLMKDEVSTTLAFSEYNLARILGWLSPLAHNMVRWQSERNFERRRLIFGTNVLLVQTLYFADREETEAAIVELLLALNHLSRFRQSSRSEVYENLRDLIHFRT